VFAIGILQFGPPEVLQPIDLPLPEPGAGEIRLRVDAAAVNPTDTIFRAGAGQARLLGDRPPPWVPGMDAAGHVDKIGPHADTDLAVGDPAIALVLPAGPHGGAYARYIIAPATAVAPAPDGWTLAEAATLPLNALAATASLQALQLPEHATLAVTGAVGAVGGYAIQLAKHAGLTVIADAHPADTDQVRALGADITITRGAGYAHALRAIAPNGADGLIDAADQHAEILHAVADSGGLVELRGWTDTTPRQITVHNVVGPKAADDPAALRHVADLATAGVLTPRVAEVLPATRADDAHRRLEKGGVRGRLVLDLTLDD
jgi:NADPH2:quinone reductase